MQRHIKRQQPTLQDTTLVLATQATVSSIILAPSTSKWTAPTSYGHISPLATLTDEATSNPSSISNESSISSSGLIAGLCVAFVVVIVGLVFLLIRLKRKKQKSDPSRNPFSDSNQTMTERSPQRRSSILRQFPLPPIPSGNMSFSSSNFDAASVAETDRFAPSVNRNADSSEINKKANNRMSTISWFSLGRGKPKLWRKSTSASNAEKFAWYRSGADMATKPPSPDVFERASPLSELSEKAAMKLARSESSNSVPTVPSHAHYVGGPLPSRYTPTSRLGVVSPSFTERNLSVLSLPQSMSASRSVISSYSGDLPT